LAICPPPGGTFILRIEDTDELRSTTESVSGILESMRWLGLDWDEGPDFNVGTVPAGTVPQFASRGDKGPYFQMERIKHYQAAGEQLLVKGLAYPCYCTSEEVEKMRQMALLAKRPPKYDGTCRGLDAEGRRRKRRKAGKNPSD